MAKLSVRAPQTAAAASPTFAAKAPGKGPTVNFSTAGALQRRRRRSFGRPINGKGLAVFTRQLATLVKAGMPILRSLEVLARCLSTRRGKKVDRAEAAAFLGLLVGTLQLARATPDRAESGAILAAGVGAALRLANGR